MTRPSESRLDDATRSVLGIPTYLDQLEPESGAARAHIANLDWFGPGDRERRRSEIEALEQTEAWVDSEPEAHRSTRDHLSELPTLTAALNALDSDAVLGEGDLFDLKRFLYFGVRILEAAEELVAAFGRPRVWRRQLSDMIDAIHPGGASTPRFHLAAELDDALREAIERRRSLESSLRDLRDETESRIVDDLGGSFDIRGRFRPPEGLAKRDIEEHPALASRDDGRYATSERLETTKTELEDARRELETVEARVRAELSDELRPRSDLLERVSAFFVDLDVRLAKVRLKHTIDGCWGDWNSSIEESRFTIERGREPRIHTRTADEGGAAQPIDFAASDRPAVVTGPNMGGKSALLDLVGLCHWCAQHALPVPAASFRFAPVDSIVYVGSEEPNAVDASHGLSSFGREVRRIADWLERADGRTLWLLDEIGRGTHPEDGAAMALDLVERLEARDDLVLAATHFPALAASPHADHFRIRGIVDRDELTSKLAAAKGLDEIESALRSSMDFQPERTENKHGSVPRDARLVARALGLGLEEQD